MTFARSTRSMLACMVGIFVFGVSVLERLSDARLAFAAPPTTTTAPTTEPADTVPARLTGERALEFLLPQASGDLSVGAYVRDCLTLYAKQVGYLSTARSISVPMRADFVVKTDSSNVRLYFGKGRAIFNWEVTPTQLRYEDPVTREEHHQDNRGRIPIDSFVKISWIVTESASRLLVDGVERATIPCNAKGMESPIGIGPALGSTITVKSLVVREGNSIVIDSTKPVLTR